MDGTFILNIKENVVQGERSTYVLELILALKQQGWRWTEEFIWHKKNSFPGKWPNRFRDAWERVLQFNKNKKFAMYQDAVKVQIGSWSKSRLKTLSAKDMQRQESSVGSGFGKNISNWKDKTLVYPTNVLHISTECGNKNHCATFPYALPEWFIKLFTREGDSILDPFMGSGTSLYAAIDLGRDAFGIEIEAEYYNIVEKKLRERYNEK
jgi:site-specific DNA-methyltransferase (adenine-specific)/site-specific DNA-methyltransferase (cytosine-N4-specific)